MGKGGGSSYSTSTTTPWREQAQYLNPYFAQVFGGATGFKPPEVDKQGDIIGFEQDPVTKEYLKDAYGEKIPKKGTWLTQDSPEYQRFMGYGAPGKLRYFGEEEKLWSPFDTAKTSTKGIGGTAIPLTEAPNVVGFAPEEKIAQGIVRSRLGKQGSYYDPLSAVTYDTGYTNLIPSAKTALEDIIKGTDRIAPASMTAAKVLAPSTITKPAIGIPDSMDTPIIGSTDLGFRNWNELEDVASGNRNPYLEDMISNATRNLRNEHFNYEVPALDSTAELAGRYGGNRWSKLRTDAYDKYLENAGQVETTMRGEAYNTDANRALQALNLSGNLATTQAGFDADRATRQAAMEMDRRAKEYDTSALAKRLTGELGLTAETAQSGNELSRLIQNALLSQEAGKTTAGFEQQANVGNIANILQGAPLAPTVAQSDYADIGQLANVGEARAGKMQDVVDAFLNRFNINMLEPYERASIISSAISGNYGGTTTGRQAGGGKGGLF